MRRDEEGSVLIEALIASALLALILVGVFRTFGDSAARHAAVEGRRNALMIARSQLDAAGFAAPLTEGTLTGVDGDYAWRLDTARCPGGLRSAAGELYCLTVAVRLPGEARPAVVLSSRRLGPEA